MQSRKEQIISNRGSFYRYRACLQQKLLKILLKQIIKPKYLNAWEIFW